MTSLSIIKSIKQSSKSDGDLDIIKRLLSENENSVNYFPDKELFCLEHLVAKINSANKDTCTMANNELFYDSFELIYEATQENPKSFISIIKNVKLSNVLLNVDFENKHLLSNVNKKFLDLLIKSNIEFSEFKSEKFILKLLNSYTDSRYKETNVASSYKDTDVDSGNKETNVASSYKDTTVDNKFISNLVRLIQFSKFVSNEDILFKLIKLENDEVNQVILNELFDDKLFKLTPFIENLSPKSSSDEALLKFFELLCIGYLNNTDKFSKDILDISLNKVVGLSTDKANVFAMCLSYINGHFELKKLNNLPKLETLEKWLASYFTVSEAEIDIANVFIQCLRNNIEIGYKYKEKILTILEKTENVDLCESLINCFVDFKEFDSLIKFIVENDLSYMSKYEHLFTDKIHNITGYQLFELLSQDCKFLKNSIIKGMINVNTITFIQNSDSLQNWLKQSIFEKTSLADLETFYHLLSLYSNSIIPNITFNKDIKDSYTAELDNLIKLQLESFDYKNLNSYFCIFKTFEISVEYDTVAVDVESIITKFVENFKDNLTESISLVKNFTTIINNNINSESLKELFGALFFANTKNVETLMQQLFFIDGVESKDIWEESVLVEEFKKRIVSLICTSDLGDDSSVVYKALAIIPVELFNKFEKSSILEKLYTLEDVDSLLLKFLLTPTFKTSLELQENFTALLARNNTTLFNKIWGNYIINANDKFCFDYLNKSILQLIKSLPHLQETNLLCVIDILKYSKGAEKIKDLISDLFGSLLQRLRTESPSHTNSYSYLYQLYELDSDNEELNNLILEFVDSKDIDSVGFELQFNLYVACCIIKNKSYYDILPTYLSLRKSLKISSITDGLALYLTNLSEKDSETLLKLITDLITDSEMEYKPYMLELINFVLPKINKNNDEDVYCKLFALLLNNLLENIELVDLAFLQNLSNVVISKSWILKQYNIELVVPFLIKTISNSKNKALILESLKIMSNIINYQQFKLVRRAHLINTFIVFSMDYLVQFSSSDSEDLLKSLNRLIENYIDPINIVSSNSNSSSESFKSNILTYKQELRKYIYPVMLKYVSILCDIKVSTAENLKAFNTFRNGLKPSMYSIFDLLIKENLNMLYNLLDYNGKLYFKKLYKDYETEGKWKED